MTNWPITCKFYEILAGTLLWNFKHMNRTTSTGTLTKTDTGLFREGQKIYIKVQKLQWCTYDIAEHRCITVHLIFRYMATKCLSIQPGNKVSFNSTILGERNMLDAGMTNTLSISFQVIRKFIFLFPSMTLECML